MAIITYSTTDIDFSTFDTWSNDGFTDNTDITLSNQVGVIFHCLSCFLLYRLPLDGLAFQLVFGFAL